MAYKNAPQTQNGGKECKKPKPNMAYKGAKSQNPIWRIRMQKSQNRKPNMATSAFTPRPRWPKRKVLTH